jgi:hypothetical protein
VGISLPTAFCCAHEIRKSCDISATIADIDTVKVGVNYRFGSY